MAVSATGLGITGLVSDGASVAAFALMVVFLVGFGLLYGILGPVRQAYINEHIPSAQRATVLSFDSFFADIGAVAGQVGLGYGAQVASKAVAYTIGGVVYFISVPLYRRAGKSSDRLPTLPTKTVDGGTRDDIAEGGQLPLPTPPEVT